MNQSESCGDDSAQQEMALAGNDPRVCLSEVQYGDLVENWVSRIICRPATGRWSADPEIELGS